MKKIYENLVERLENKKEELKHKQEYFIVLCHSEMESKTFERNAINDLLIMQQLKSEISELEHMEILYRMYAEINN